MRRAMWYDTLCGMIFCQEPNRSDRFLILKGGVVRCWHNWRFRIS